MKTHWIKRTGIILLSCAATFVLGAGGSLLWSSYAGEMPHGSTPIEHQLQEKAICDEVERNALVAGLIGAIGGVICLTVSRFTVPQRKLEAGEPGRIMKSEDHSVGE